jgi:hypothetical protein
VSKDFEAQAFYGEGYYKAKGSVVESVEDSKFSGVLV